MDNSKLRRGQPCWHLQEGVGVAAINDALLLEASIYTLLKKYFDGKECYKYVSGLLHETATKTIMGQSLDMMCQNPDGSPRLDAFTMNRYQTIVKYKSGYTLLLLPVGLAMYLSNRYDPEEHRQVERICIELGNFYQLQNDVMDCFGDRELIGKESTDIQEGKCSWLVAEALERATPAGKKLLKEHYGKANQNSIQMVQQLYTDLDLPTVFATVEEESFNKVCSLIEEVKGVPHELFSRLVATIYGRHI
ncbi:unnamed protein product [Acanthoscelides obtectus]|uniref:Farnesyl diphosphate synthase n=1 Tax=Acanthoscelides obtectus TaxID=200917 RepID=A0A9P0JN41_ACAOB|nr:unnamed protein product [Acanthoscelides obtectus]CAK1665783.1 Farnesyl pyrophosphate synthase [Acanthoscelides obtectus]